ncbi:MAG: GAF domain-containing protein [Anaerolineales bacterium]|nr:GAF domain-containing protein [Anaerolineales bacterium]
MDDTELAISQTVVDQVISENQPILTTDAQLDPRFERQESIIAHNLRSILCAPLNLKGELIGVIYIDNRIRSGIFRITHLNLLLTVADQAAVAIENARLFESIRNSLTEVTGLKNLMDNVFASITSGVITINGSDIITLSNQAAEVMVGWEEGSLIGHHISKILPWMKADLRRYLPSVRDTNRQIVGLEYRPVIATRGLVTFTISISPLRGSQQNDRSIAIVIDDQTEKKRLEAHRYLFTRMVSPAVIEELEKNDVPLQGKRTFITTLFADIRNFTQFSEKSHPEVLVEVLNRYLGVAVDAVLANEGTVDKFQGDAIMAFFNAPLTQSDHVLRAVSSALDIQKSVENLREIIPPEMRLSFGIGIHYGEAVLGLIGTEQRMEYTAIGDSVNTSKRLQENAAAGQILISSTAVAQVTNLVDCNPVAPIRAKGKSDPIEVYELLGLNLDAQFLVSRRK